jgi:hypothetical protein
MSASDSNSASHHDSSSSMEICVINWAAQLVKAVCAVREMSADDGTSEMTPRRTQVADVPEADIDS